MRDRASGQFLNKEKTAMFFSSNTDSENRRKILREGGDLVKGSYERYLGLPTLVGKSKYNTFRCLKEGVWQKINNWKNSFLSSAGKEIMIKTVLQAIPSYTMSVFKLPKKLICKELNGMLAKFWWGNQQRECCIQWRSWKKMGQSKENGGVGFRDLENFNLALPGRILQNPSSLTTKIYKEKYLRNFSLLEVKLGNTPSLIWRSVWSYMGLLKEGLRWRVGNGNKIQIWGQK
ncbi:uncharacterized mitochondrial protein AtMg00310-like [Carya illinoinensis]|uniref:uncharacterized mitochondrial protein AtMg00310-like n=1 Tax=Carya illinoinensis TaxID=32201 RepID=UPI001C71D079|nr:uncharacterized mitochondrial protein AtMg00310-like [Carya illinoinensis]